MAKRKGISKTTRFEVFKRDSFTCQYCGRSAPEIVLHLDHIQPVSKNGDNSIFNYITSCVDCNLGKSDRELSDRSVIQKQKAQLDELNERREQLEMMVQWRSGLADLGELEVDAFDNAWGNIATGYSLSETGRLTARKLIAKYGLNKCLDAIQKTITYLETSYDGTLSKESVGNAFQKIAGILKIESLPEWKRTLLHIRNTACAGKYWQPSTKGMILEKFERLYHLGVNLDDLMAIARQRLSFDTLQDTLEYRIQEME